MSAHDLLNRIHQRLEQTGVKARRASIDAGMSPDAIRDIERNPSKSVTLRTIEALARSLDVSPEWLAFGSGPEAATRVAVPHVSWVSAGSFREVGQAMPTDEFPAIEAAGLPPGDWFALTVEGDSMDRISPPGSVIFVNRRDKKLVPNACYVIANEAGEATYKRYRPNPERFEPVSVNPNIDPVYPDGAINVIGRVRRSMIDF